MLSRIVTAVRDWREHQRKVAEAQQAAIAAFNNERCVMKIRFKDH